MLFAGGVLVVLLVWAIVGGFAVNRGCSGWDKHFKTLAVTLPAGLLFLAILWTCSVLAQPEYRWNQARLAPLFGLKYGYHLYNPAEEGPVLGAIYGPISYLAFSPALVAATPIPAVLIGSVTASIYYFGPAVWLFMCALPRRREARAVGLFLVVIFGLWTLGSRPFRDCCFHIHADAPALGFGAIACGLFVRRSESPPGMRLLALSAFFAGLGIFSKQSMIFLAPTLVGFVWLAYGRRTALRFAAVSGAVFAAILAVLCFLFSAQALYFNMYAFPSHHGFGHNSFMQIPPRTAAAIVETFTWAATDLWEYARWPLLALGVCYAVEICITQPKQFVVREWVRRNPWSVFHFVAIAGLPFALLFHAKLGGDVNVLSVHLYFCVIGLLLFCGHLMLAHQNTSRPAVAACLMLAATLAPLAFIVPSIPGRIRGAWNTKTEQVYQYDKRHPGEALFSWYPLSVLMAEGKMYHFEYGVFDRELGLARVSQEHFQRFIPPHMKYLSGGSYLDGPFSKYLPEFRCLVKLPEIPADMLVYAECAGKPATPVQNGPLPDAENREEYH